MKISELARLTGISANAIGQIYHDKTKGIDFATLNKLCWALECDTNDIFAYIEDLQ